MKKKNMFHVKHIFLFKRLKKEKVCGTIKVTI